MRRWQRPGLPRLFRPMGDAVSLENQKDISFTSGVIVKLFERDDGADTDDFLGSAKIYASETGEDTETFTLHDARYILTYEVIA